MDTKNNDRPVISFSASRHQHIHMAGIGGSGMSGLALLLKSMGFKIAGSDLKESAVLERLRRAGIEVYLGHRSRNINRKTQLLVYSSAVDCRRNPEVLEAKRRGLAIARRGSLLAQISSLKRSITVCGTHGKTTTSSMIGWILGQAGFKPTVIVGGEVRNWRSNMLSGDGQWFVLETDESDGSFLETQPWIAVATNVDNDHVEHYGSFGRLKEAFLTHLKQVPALGHVVLGWDDEILRSMVAPKLKARVTSFGLRRGSFCRAADLVKEKNGYSFSLIWDGKKRQRVSLSIGGLHNVLNALAAAAAAHLAGVSWDHIARALRAYKGIRRRLEVLGKKNGLLFLDDYGHHPSEIAATIKAVREFHRFKRLLVCFQPHRYSRTKMLAARFAAALQPADFVWVLPIYAASEKAIAGVSHELILKSLKRNGVACAPFPGRPYDLLKEIKPGDCLLTIGAGDVWKVGEDLLRRV